MTLNPELSPESTVGMADALATAAGIRGARAMDEQALPSPGSQTASSDTSRRRRQTRRAEGLLAAGRGERFYQALAWVGWPSVRIRHNLCPFARGRL